MAKHELSTMIGNIDKMLDILDDEIDKIYEDIKHKEVEINWQTRLEVEFPEYYDPALICNIEFQKVDLNVLLSQSLTKKNLLEKALTALELVSEM